MYLMTIILIQALCIRISDSYIEINVTNSCGKSYNIEEKDEARIVYNGEESLRYCTIELTTKMRNTLCITPHTLKLSCSSSVKYFDFSPIEWFGIEKMYTCEQISYDIWCYESHSIFVTLESLDERDTIILLVHIKTPFPVYGIVLSAMLPIIVLVLGCVFYCKCKVAKLQRQQLRIGTGTRTVTSIQPSVVLHQTYPVTTHVPVSPRSQRHSNVKTINIPLQHVPTRTTSPGQHRGQPVSQFQPTHETRFGPNLPSVSQQVLAPATLRFVGTSNYQQQMPPSGTRTVTSIQPSLAPNQTIPVTTHIPGSPRTQRHSNVKNTNTPLKHVPTRTTSQGQHRGQPVSQYQPTQETMFGPNLPGVSQNVHATTTSDASTYQPQMPISGTRTVIQPSVAPHQTYPVTTHVPVSPRSQKHSNVKNINIPLQHVPTRTTSPGQHRGQPVCQYQPTQETRFGPNLPNISQQVQAPATSRFVGPPNTSGTSNYQPQIPPSGPPPSYEVAVGSTYHERMEEYSTNWDSKQK